jgi:hypothetical protein
LESAHQSLRKIKSWKKSNIFWQNRTFFGKIEHFSKKVTKNQLWGCTFMANSGYHLVLSYYAICILWKIRVWCSTLSHSITVLPPLKFPSLAAATGALREVEAYTGQPAQRMRRLSPVPRSALSVFCFSWWAVRVQVLLFLRCCVEFLLCWSFRVWRLAFVVVPFLSAVVDFRRFRCFDSSTFLTFGCPPSFTFHPLFVAASLPRFWVFLGVLLDV